MIDLEWIVRRIEVEREIKIPLHWLTVQDCQTLYNKYKISCIKEDNYILLGMEEDIYDR